MTIDERIQRVESNLTMAKRGARGPQIEVASGQVYATCAIAEAVLVLAERLDDFRRLGLPVERVS
jgi:hypothetical protein